jgi:hypothetical protein
MDVFSSLLDALASKGPPWLDAAALLMGATGLLLALLWLVLYRDKAK